MPGPSRPEVSQVPISPSVQSLRQAEWKSTLPPVEARGNLPDLRMQAVLPGAAGGTDDEKARMERAKIENLYAHGLRREELLGGREGESGYVGKFLNAVVDLGNVGTAESRQQEKSKLEEKLRRLPTTPKNERKRASLRSQIESLSLDPEVEKELLRERISEAYVHINHVCLDEMNVVSGYLERLRNGFPYEIRWSIQLYDNLEKKVNGLLREKGNREVKDTEAKALLKMFRRDTKWFLATARVSEAMGPSCELYYDGELELQMLRTVHSELLASDFVQAFSEEVEGLELTDDEKALVKLSLAKTPNGYIEDEERYAGMKERGLRESAIQYQDRAGFWILAAAAAGQKNLEYGWGTDPEAGEHYMNISYTYFRFLSEVFDAGRGIDENYNLEYRNSKNEKFKVKKEILNPFCMSRDDDVAYQEYMARMHELVVGSGSYAAALQRIKGDKTLNNDAQEQAIVELANKVVERAKKDIKDWHSLELRNPYDRLAYTVILNQINLERGILASGDLGWYWNYELDAATGKVKRKSEFGSIYDDHDVHTVVFWARHVIDYDQLADSRGALLFPTIGWYREMWENQPPYWKPEIATLAKDDHLLLRLLGLEGDRGILSDENEFEGRVARWVYLNGKKGKQPQYYGKFDPNVKEFIRENMWGFVTPWLDNPKAGGYNLVLPVFLPTYMEDINFWRAVSLREPADKLRKKNDPDRYKRSIWHDRLKGTRLSKMIWKNMPKYKYNWAMVNRDQKERWFGPWITPHQFNESTGREFEKHYENGPTGRPSKEGGKRFRLGGRASRWFDGIWRAAVASQAKILSTVFVSNVLDNAADVTRREAAFNSWKYERAAKWMNVELDMPTLVRGVENYPGTAAQVIYVTHRQVGRIMESSLIHSVGQTDDVYKSIQELDKLF